MKSQGKPRTISHQVWPLLALAAVLSFNFIFTENFFSITVREGRLYGSLIDILDRAAPVMLVALGMTLVIATGGVDLSVGAVVAIAGAVAAGVVAHPAGTLFAGLPFGGMAAVLCAVAAVALLAGLINGGMVAWFDVQPFVATLILMVAGRGIAQLLTDGQIVTFSNHPLVYVGNDYLFGLPFTITLVALTFAALWVLMRKTALGLFVESVGNNANASRYAGIDIRLVKLLVYLAVAVCAALAGLIQVSDIKAADSNNAGMYLELDAILAVVVGGTAMTGGRFSLAGSLVGAVLIQSVTTTILTRGVPVEFTLVVKAVVIVLICLLQSAAFRRAIMGRLRRIAA